MPSQETELQGTTAAVAVPDWLRGLIRAVRQEGFQPKDARVKLLWDVLRQRQLLGQSRWLTGVLLRTWNRGAPARERPRVTRRLVELLRGWGLLGPLAVPEVVPQPIAMRPFGPVPIRPQPLRRVTVQPIRPVKMRSVVARAGVRR